MDGTESTGWGNGDELPYARSYPRSKAFARRTFLNLAGVRRIHIVGAARSGTTMLHYAMAAFEGTLLHPRGTDVRWTPSLSDSGRLWMRSVVRRSRPILVTKRSYGWYRADALRALTEHALRDGIGVIHVVRDPRHAERAEQRFYLEPDRWLRSVDAGRTLLGRLGDRVPNLEVRYEDVVTNPAGVQDLLMATFDLRLRAGVTSWANLSENLAAIDVSPAMASYMHGVRDFDPNSIGRWRDDPEKSAYLETLLADPTFSSRVDEFMRRHSYERA